VTVCKKVHYTEVKEVAVHRYPPGDRKRSRRRSPHTVTRNVSECVVKQVPYTVTPTSRARGVDTAATPYGLPVSVGFRAVALRVHRRGCRSGAASAPGAGSAPCRRVPSRKARVTRRPRATRPAGWSRKTPGQEGSLHRVGECGRGASRRCRCRFAAWSRRGVQEGAVTVCEMQKFTTCKKVAYTVCEQVP